MRFCASSAVLSCFVSVIVFTSSTAVHKKRRPAKGGVLGAVSRLERCLGSRHARNRIDRLTTSAQHHGLGIVLFIVCIIRGAHTTTLLGLCQLFLFFFLALVQRPLFPRTDSISPPSPPPPPLPPLLPLLLLLVLLLLLRSHARPHFQNSGTVQSAHVQIAPSGRSKGWG